VRGPEHSQGEGRRRSGSLLASVPRCPPRLTATGTAQLPAERRVFLRRWAVKSASVGGSASPAVRPLGVPAGTSLDGGGRGFLRSNPRSSRLSRRGTSLVLVIGLGGAHDGCVGGRSLLPSRTARGRLQGHMDFLLDKFRTNHGRWNLSHPLTFCAWCGRVRLAGRWLGKPRELEVVAHARRHATSGICPTCFAELERGSAP
jgi:hypothetical protein